VFRWCGPDWLGGGTKKAWWNYKWPVCAGMVRLDERTRLTKKIIKSPDLAVRWKCKNGQSVAPFSLAEVKRRPPAPASPAKTRRLGFVGLARPRRVVFTVLKFLFINRKKIKKRFPA